MKLIKWQSVVGVIMIAMLLVVIFLRLSEAARGSMIFFGAMIIISLLAGALIIPFAQDLLRILARFLKK